MCCFKHVLLHSVYIKLSTKQIAESDKILAWAVSQMKTQVAHWVLQQKFMWTVAITTTKPLELPDHWQPSDLYKANQTVELGLYRMVKSAVFI